MNLTEIFLLAVGLSMDAFAVSVCKGLAMKKISLSKAVIVGLWFGSFQTIMPTAGYFLASTFARYITSIDHWVAFVLLSIIGINMIREAFGGEQEDVDASLSVKNMFVMAVATSIDALAVGVTFAFEFDSAVKMFPAALLIGATTFLISTVGVKVGNVFGVRFKSKAELLGGVILIFLGFKILVEAFL